jgi:hypothetical protein
MLRPSYHELDRKLVEARRAVAENRIRTLSPGVLAADAIELDYLIEELNHVLEEILNETSPDNYAGTHPPQRSYEDKIKDKELFAFESNSQYFNKMVYLKFVLIDGYVWIVSLHNSRP